MRRRRRARCARQTGLQVIKSVRRTIEQLDRLPFTFDERIVGQLRADHRPTLLADL